MIARLRAAPDGVQSLGVRPEHISLGHSGGDMEGTVDVTEYLGADPFVFMDCGPAGQITVRVNGDAEFTPGEKASFTLK